MMRSWGNRADTVVIDEPFYAFYLARTKKAHPMANQVMSEGERDWRKVVASLTRESLPNGARVFYQKQMTHHLLPEVEWEWLLSLTNCFLIRDPAQVIASYLKKNDEPSLEDLGFMQQAEIFDWVRERSPTVPPVVDADDILQCPERILRLLCQAVGVEFDPAMLNWPPGLRETDGVWAKHWYDEVARSTSFQPYKPKVVQVPKHLSKIHEQCRECYEHLRQFRLRS
jgi:hypothetical protein